MKSRIIILCAVCSFIAPMLAIGQESDDMAAAAQNPLASMISLPFQNNTTFGGIDGDVLNILNIQPVYPFRLGEDWNLITRTIFPFISAPDPDGGQINGLGDTSFTSWFAPSKPVNNITWGIGPVVSIPTATEEAFEADQWGGGASAVAVWIKGKWVAGGLVNNVWGIDDALEFNKLLFQYFINYNLDSGWYIVSAPTITADWNVTSDERWIIPFGGGAGKVVRIGKMPINLNGQVYYNAEKPDTYGDWTARFQVQLMFPK